MNIGDEAFDSEPNEASDPVERYLASEEEARQRRDEEAMYGGMRDWFLSNYRIPTSEDLGESPEKGHIRGGRSLCEPGVVLRERFEDIADDSLIEALAQEFRSEGGEKWVPRLRAGYDERFEIEIGEPDAPLFRLRERLAKALKVLDLQGDDAAKPLLPSLVYSSAISSLEAFLYETVTYWVEGDDDVLRGIVTKLPALKDQPVKLGELFQLYEEIGVRVKGYLQNLVWHRWDKVVQLFVFGFGFHPPTFKPFEEALLKRHDIVHRSGHDKDGNPVSISRDDVVALTMAVDTFAAQVYQQTVERVLRDGEAPLPISRK